MGHFLELLSLSVISLISNCAEIFVKEKQSPVLVPLLSLYALQSLLSLHSAALSLGRQRLLVLSVRGGEKTSQSRPEGRSQRGIQRFDYTAAQML